MSLTGPEARALAAFDAERMLAFLGELVAFRSVANEESPAQERMAAEMEAAGLSVDLWAIDFDRLPRHPAYSSDVSRREGLGVVGTSAGGAGPRLILNGHIDVVPAGEVDRWRSPPFRMSRTGGRVVGRGVVDMKGALACAVFAARALRDAGVRLEGALQVQSVIGEEDGGAGTLATLERGHTGDGAIVMEPTGGVVAPSQAGALSFRLTVPGRAAHGALRHEGVDPVEKFVPVLDALRALEERRNRALPGPLFRGQTLPFALTMGRVEAGIWPSTVAEQLVAEGRYGVAPGEDPGQARRDLEAAVATVAGADPWLREHPPIVEWRGAQFAAAETPSDDRVVTTVASAVTAVTGKAPRLAGVPFGSDLRLLVNEGGIPAVLYGPGDVREAHRPDESVAESDLVEAARVLIVTALRFCGVAGEGAP